MTFLLGSMKPKSSQTLLRLDDLPPLAINVRPKVLAQTQT
jgi:hypothetical protein